MKYTIWTRYQEMVTVNFHNHTQNTHRKKSQDHRIICLMYWKYFSRFNTCEYVQSWNGIWMTHSMWWICMLHRLRNSFRRVSYQKMLQVRKRVGLDDKDVGSITNHYGYLKGMKTQCQMNFQSVKFQEGISVIGQQSEICKCYSDYRWLSKRTQH